jgi:hypothetical protein
LPCHRDDLHLPEGRSDTRVLYATQDPPRPHRSDGTEARTA